MDPSWKPDISPRPSALASTHTRPSKRKAEEQKHDGDEWEGEEDDADFSQSQEDDVDQLERHDSDVEVLNIVGPCDTCVAKHAECSSPAMDGRSGMNGCDFCYYQHRACSLIPDRKAFFDTAPGVLWLKSQGLYFTGRARGPPPKKRRPKARLTPSADHPTQSKLHTVLPPFPSSNTSSSSQLSAPAELLENSIIMESSESQHIANRAPDMRVAMLHAELDSQAARLTTLEDQMLSLRDLSRRLEVLEVVPSVFGSIQAQMALTSENLRLHLMLVSAMRRGLIFYENDDSAARSVNDGIQTIFPPAAQPFTHV